MDNKALNELAVEVALWWKRLKETNNETFLPLFFDQHRYLVIMGGGGSGKSIFAGRKILERCASEPKSRFLVCRKVGKTLRESCFHQLRDQAAKHYAADVDKVYRGEMRITFKNGSEIIFAGLDDVEKLKSIHGVTGIWAEEATELLEGDLNQLDIRLRGETKNYKQIILTFNPIHILHWLKKRFFDEADPKATTHKSTYKDNRFLDQEQREVLEALKDKDPYYYSVYALGEWGVTGTSVFDAKKVTERLQHIPQPLKIGYFTYEDTGTVLKNIQWVDDPDGFISIFQDVEEGYPYVLGGDTAGDGSDSFTAKVQNNTTGEEVAALRHRTDEDLYTKQVYCLGLYYNTALIGVETNFSTYPVMELARLGYPKQYVREVFDSYEGKLKRSYGFRTDSKSRPLILAELISFVRENVDCINDRTTLEEMLTFVRDESFRAAAAPGAHDDTVMALAICNHIRPMQDYLPTKKPAQRVEWRPDQWEDWRGADPETRKYLEKIWGSPW